MKKLRFLGPDSIYSASFQCPAYVYKEREREMQMLIVCHSFAMHLFRAAHSLRSKTESFHPL